MIDNLQSRDSSIHQVSVIAHQPESFPGLNAATHVQCGVLLAIAGLDDEDYVPVELPYSQGETYSEHLFRCIQKSDRIAYRSGEAVIEFRIVNEGTGFTVCRWIQRNSVTQRDLAYSYSGDGEVFVHEDSQPLWDILQADVLSGLAQLGNDEVRANRGNWRMRERVATWAALERAAGRHQLGGDSLLDGVSIVTAWLDYHSTRVEAFVEAERMELAASNRGLFADDSDDSDDVADTQSDADAIARLDNLHHKQAMSESDRLRNRMNAQFPAHLHTVATRWPEEK